MPGGGVSGGGRGKTGGPEEKKKKEKSKRGKKRGHRSGSESEGGSDIQTMKREHKKRGGRETDEGDEDSFHEGSPSRKRGNKGKTLTGKARDDGGSDSDSDHRRDDGGLGRGGLTPAQLDHVMSAACSTQAQYFPIDIRLLE